MRWLPAAVAAAILATTLPAAAQAPGEDAVTAMRLGKVAFEQNCRLCHGLDRSLARRDTPEGWALVVRRMAAYGAPVAAADRARIARFLAARTAFETVCGGCHEATRVVSETPGAREWSAVTARMGAHLEELKRQGKAPAGVALGPKDLEDIAALLQVTIPQ